jgi:hypothetical protein
MWPSRERLDATIARGNGLPVGAFDDTASDEKSSDTSASDGTASENSAFDNNANPPASSLSQP